MSILFGYQLMNRMKYSSEEKGNIEKRHKIGFSPRGKKTKMRHRIFSVDNSKMR